MLSQEERDDIIAYYKQKPNFIELWQKYPPSSSEPTKKQSTTTTTTTTTTMPVHPKEEEASGSK